MSLSIKVDVEALRDAVSSIHGAADVFDRSLARGINAVAAKALTQGRRAVTSQVNLTAAYVRDRTTLAKATANNPVAVIKARERSTTLARMKPQQLTAPAPAAKGDPRRGIAAGRKQAGVSVHVKRANGRKRMPGAFMLPLRAGSTSGGNGMGIFTRTGKRPGDIEHKYTRSVSAWFRDGLDDLADFTASELDTAVLRQLDYEIRKALKL